MIIIGCRSGADISSAIKSISKHTNIPIQDSKKIIDSVMDGHTYKLPDDFVLREDLEYYRFIIK